MSDDVSTNGAGVWRWISGILASILITGMVSWLSFGGGVTENQVRRMIQDSAVNEDEVRRMIRERSPYNEDRKLVIDKLIRIEADMKDVKTQLRELSSNRGP